MGLGYIQLTKYLFASVPQRICHFHQPYFSPQTYFLCKNIHYFSRRRMHGWKWGFGLFDILSASVIIGGSPENSNVGDIADLSLTRKERKYPLQCGLRDSVDNTRCSFVCRYYSELVGIEWPRLAMQIVINIGLGTIVDLSSAKSCGIHLREISLETLSISIIRTCCKIKQLKHRPYFSGDNELMGLKNS